MPLIVMMLEKQPPFLKVASNQKLNSKLKDPQKSRFIIETNLKKLLEV